MFKIIYIPTATYLHYPHTGEDRTYTTYDQANKVILANEKYTEGVFKSYLFEIVEVDDAIIYRIMYLPTATLVPAFLDTVDYIFTTKKAAQAIINDNRIVSDSLNGDYVYINSSSSVYNNIPKHLLEVVEVDK